MQFGDNVDHASRITEIRAGIRDAMKVLRDFQPATPDAFIASIISIFLGSAPQHIEKIKAAMLAPNTGEVEKAGHALRGSCLSIGAVRMAELCQKAEQGARLGINILSDQVQEIEVEFNLVAAELRLQVQGGAA
jgi:HPt (histidine-containing phosphotransfer) domain-containing protein